MPASPTKKTVIQRATAADRHHDVWTIWYAAQHGKLARMHSILSRRSTASVDVQEFRTGWSALHFACRYGHSKVVEMLIQRGANTDLPDWQGNTPLHLSAGWGNLQCCVLVLEGGADMRVRNNAKQTPAELAGVLAREDICGLFAKWKPLGLSAQDLELQRLEAVTASHEADSLVQLKRLMSEERDTRVHRELNALYVKRQSFGDEHPGLLATYSKLTELLRTESRLDLAAQFADDGLTLSELVNGRPHIVTARWLTDMGDLALQQDKYEEGCDLFVEAYAELLELKGEMDHETLTALENVAIASLTAGHTAEARENLILLIDRLDQLYNGGSNAHMLHLKLQLAALFVHGKQIDAARVLYTECLAHSSSSCSEFHDVAITCTDGLGKCFFLLGDFEEAERYFQRSLQTHRKLCTSSSLCIGAAGSCASCQRTHNNLAMVAIAHRSTNAVRIRLATDLAV